MLRSRSLLPQAAGAALAALVATSALAAPKADAEMQAVLDALKALDAKAVHTLTVPEARMQASPADAARMVQREKRVPPTPEIKVDAKDIAIPGADGNLLARVYTPEGAGPFPVIVYYHGGGWVIADLNVYDGAPRALANAVGAVVVSAEYRHAPEYKFPAAHDDAWAAYQWVAANAASLKGDPARIAVAGESAGGNLAINVALMAREAGGAQPVHQLLVYPVAGNDTNTPSYKENADAVPLGKADMEWFFQYTLASPDDAKDPRLNLVGRDDLKGLPSATVITAEIDPLRSEGQMLAEKLKAAGVSVDAIDVPGVTHEFFGMGKVVPAAKTTFDAAVADLRKAFGN